MLRAIPVQRHFLGVLGSPEAKRCGRCPWRVPQTCGTLGASGWGTVRDWGLEEGPSGAGTHNTALRCL